MSGIFHEGRWYENTDMVCRRCGHPVYKSDISEYSYQCFHCDEDLYSFEATEQDAHYLPPVMVARPVDGITINEQLEYLLDDTGRPAYSKTSRKPRRFAGTWLYRGGFGAFLFCGGGGK